MIVKFLPSLEGAPPPTQLQFSPSAQTKFVICDCTIEIIFEEGKGELGFDHYETRSWLGWQHHLLLVALAHHFLVRLRLKFKDKAPALTIYQVRLLLTSVLPKPLFDAAAALRRPLLPKT